MSCSSKKTNKCGADILIFTCWLIYSVSYIGKVNYSANIGGIIDFFNVSKAEAGIPPTFFFFAYGVGQVVNGILCKRYNTKWVIFSSLFISAVINLLVALTVNFGFIKWLWMINGFCYLGSTLSSYGFGAVADNFGWMMIFWIILAISFVICLICFGYFCFKKRAHRINS